MILAALAAVVFTVGAPLLVWRWLQSRQYRPVGWEVALQVAWCAGLQMAWDTRPAVIWVPGEHYRDPFGRDIAGQWGPGKLTIAKAEGQKFSDTALAFELGREFMIQQLGIECDDEPPNLPPELIAAEGRARAALHAAGM